MQNKSNRLKPTKVLLGLMPFWDPLIPPLGISCLKSYLKQNGYDVTTKDSNIEKKFRNEYDRYFTLLADYIPNGKKGNFYNLGHDVLRNHMMAYLNYKDKNTYLNFIQILIQRVFFCRISDKNLNALDGIISKFYNKLEKYILQLINREKPTVLGLSVYSGNVAASLFAFKLAKEYDPTIKTVMGGGIFADQLAINSPNFDFFLKRTLYIDAFIVGEGEILFLKLLQGKLPEFQRVFTIEDIDNQYVDFTSLTPPDFSDFDLRYYPSLAAYTSRSCPFQCSFCTETVQWGEYRKKTAKQVVEETLQLYKKHGFQLFLLCDSLLNPIITDLANAYTKAPVSIYWDGYLRVEDKVCETKNTLLWRSGGFYRARLGVESGSQRILNRMNKKITLEQIKVSLFSLAYAGIKTTTYWIIGYPGETEDDFLQSLCLIEKLKDFIYEAECNMFWYFPVNQPKSVDWVSKSSPLYPEDFKDMLLIRSWVADCQPSREEIHKRICRFVEHCNKLGIPNPYSLQDIYKADKRWKRLHRNAVPMLIELGDMDNYTDENRYIKELSLAQNKFLNNESGDFVF